MRPGWRRYCLPWKNWSPAEPVAAHDRAAARLCRVESLRGVKPYLFRNSHKSTPFSERRQPASLRPSPPPRKRHKRDSARNPSFSDARPAIHGHLRTFPAAPVRDCHLENQSAELPSGLRFPATVYLCDGVGVDPPTPTPADESTRLILHQRRFRRMNPTDFLDLAGRLATVGTEAAFRTAVSGPTVANFIWPSC